VSEFHTQYLYSTESQKEATVGAHTGKTFPPKGKAGETHFEDAYIRVAQQDGTSTSERLELLDSRLVPMWINDQKVRDAICSFNSPLPGIKFQSSRMDKDREWIDFHGLTHADEMKRVWNEAINYLLHGVRAPYDFANFEYQQQIVDWAVARFQAGETDVLINAIMRAGKCKISYEIAKAISAKNILVITAKPGVDDSWAELLPYGDKPHVNYVDWKYHSYNDYKNKPLDLVDATTNVVFISLQYINTHFDNPSRLLAEIINVNWDVVFFDEQHYATQTSNTVNILTKLKFKKKVELSGTPYKTLLSGRYDRDNIYNFDYIDEQKIRQGADKDSVLYKAFEYRADINWALVTVPDNIKALLGEEGFTHAKLLATDKQGTFINQPAVVEYIRFVQKRSYKTPPGRFMNMANLNRHTIWVMPDNVKAIGAMAKLLASDPYFGKFAIINGSGKGVKDIDEVKQIIQNVESGKVDGNGTITLTCGRFLEGTTVPEWCAVHQMNDDKSASDYFQGSFRCKSSWPEGNKHSVMVFDYNPQRAIGTMYKHVIDTADRDNGETNEQRFREWLACSEVYDYDNGWNVMDGSLIIQKANEDVEFHSDAFGDILPDRQSIDAKIVAMMAKIDIGSKKKETSTSLNDNGLEEGKNHTTTDVDNTDSEPAAPANDIVELTILKIKQSIKRIPALIYNTAFESSKINNVEDICNYPNTEFVQIHTGLTELEWRTLVNTFNSVQKERINRRIDALVHSGVL
jgi:hypothetical protein